MILYLFKSTLCSLILWSIYKLFLESEKLHVFNRFYLLLSLVFAFTIPLVSVELSSATAENNLVAFKKTIEVQPSLLHAITPVETVEIQKTIPWLEYLVLLSSLISLFFLVRFLNNLSIIFKKIRENPTVKWQGAKLILLEEKILPYTFLNHIFINKEHYETARIESELFSHELAHVRQKHSLDVILLELLRILFWFNPLLYLFKQSIQLNHEFLADEAVNKTYHDVTAYQYLLLSKASQLSGLSLTSNLNFQITKKRLLMMTRITPQSTAFVKKAISIQLFVALAFFLADFQLIAQEPKAKKSPPTIIKASPQKDAIEEVVVVTKEKDRVLIIEKDGKNIYKEYDKLTDEEKSKIPKLLYLKRDTPTQEEMDKWKEAKMYGVWINNKRIANSTLAKYKAGDIANFFVSKLEKNAINYGKHYFQVDLMTNDYYDNTYLKEVREVPVFFIDKREKKGK